VTDLAAVRDFLRGHHRAILLTWRPDGTPHMSPVAVAVEPGGQAVISTRDGAVKARNVRADPRVSLCVLSDAWFGPWVAVDGRAVVDDGPDVEEALVAYYRAVAGEHPDWSEYRASLRAEQRVLLRVDLERVSASQLG